MQKHNTQYGAALRYSEDDDIPVIIAAAKGELVEKFCEIADKYNIPVFRDAVLAEALAGESVQTAVPERLFPAVAEVLAFCYRVDSAFALRIDGRFKKDRFE